MALGNFSIVVTYTNSVDDYNININYSDDIRIKREEVMENIVIKNRHEYLNFKDLCLGDMFIGGYCWDEVYIKTVSYELYGIERNAVNVKTGCLCFVKDNAVVKKVLNMTLEVDDES